MDPAQLFATSVSLIDRIAAGVCRRAHLTSEDAEDFAADVKLALLDRDYAILREFQGRSTLQSFLAVVIERLYLDQRTRKLGRWFASARAERMGNAAVLLETLLRRDGRALEQAIPIMRSAYPDLSREEIEKLANELPIRGPRPRLVTLDDATHDRLPASDHADARTSEREARATAARLSRVMHAELAALDVEDRTILRMRFGGSLTIVEISRMLRLPQRPLYRRIEALLLRLRRAVVANGIDASSVIDVINALTVELQFSLDSLENPAPAQSNDRRVDTRS